MNGSKYLLRANPALTTNYKLLTDSTYNLYLESYSVNTELSDKRFKKFLISPESFLSERLALYYENLPTNLAYEVKNDIKSNVVQNQYEYQFDDTYYSGARYVEDTRYSEEFQYNTTLSIDPNNLPKLFMILRLDGPGIFNMTNHSDGSAAGTDEELWKDSLKKLKVVKHFDLTNSSKLGQFFEKNYVLDDQILQAPVEFNFNQFEFSKFNGYDYWSGGTASKSLFMQDWMQNENTPFEFEKYITSKFQELGVISSNFINISYLFDDTVSGIFLPNVVYSFTDYPQLKKFIDEDLILSDSISALTSTTVTFNTYVPWKKRWTLNRYYGFYFDDMLQIDTLSPNELEPFNTGIGIQIVDNKFEIAGTPTNPVNNFEEGKPYWIKIAKKYYEIKYNGTEWVIISDTLFNDTLDNVITNAQKRIKLSYELSSGSYYYFLKWSDDSYYWDSGFLNYAYSSPSITTEIKNLFFLKMADNYYNLVVDNVAQKVYIVTDELLDLSSNSLKSTLGFNSTVTTSFKINSLSDEPTYFEILVAKFTPICDFDYRRLNTGFTEIENDKDIEFNTNRPFLSSINTSDVGEPKDLEFETGYDLKVHDTASSSTTTLYTKDEQYLLPLASEYASSGDLYMTYDNQLTKIWDINQSIVKWGMLHSINNCSYPYKMNNSMLSAGVNNFTPNGDELIPNLKEFNLDWFYTVGYPVQYSDTTTTFPGGGSQLPTYINRSLNVDIPTLQDTFINPLTVTYKFSIDYYKSLNTTIDYFDWFFNVTNNFLANDMTTNWHKNYERISRFIANDGVNGNSTFFKGINFYLQYVNLNNPNLNNNDFNIEASNDLTGYGFSVLFDNKETDDNALWGKAGIDIIINKKWENMLIYVYIYTPFCKATTLHFRDRDEAYLDQKVRYLDDLDTWTDSELTMSDLVLNNILNVLGEQKNEYASFSAGINYEIIEDETLWAITALSGVYDGILGKTLLTITLDKNLPYKHDDWIYITDTGLVDYDNINFKIVNKINNYSFTIYVDGDQTANIVTINAIFNIVKVYKEKSKLPFRLKIIEPNVIRINRQINKVISEGICNLVPKNSIISMSSFTYETNYIFDNTVRDTIDWVWSGQDIDKKIIKELESDNISYSQIDKLPAINRWGGFYSPILQEINLFSRSQLKCYNDDSFNSKTVSYIESVFNADLGKWYVAVHVQEEDVILQPNLAIGDIFFTYRSNNITDLYHKWGSVLDFELSSFINNSNGYGIGSFGYKITLDLLFDVDPFLTPLDLRTVSSTFLIALCKYVPKNVSFDFDLMDFGVIKEHTIAKVYDTFNPLASANNGSTLSVFPMIDEHGVTSINRFIFKSNWDREFYYTVKSNRYV